MDTLQGFSRLIFGSSVALAALAGTTVQAATPAPPAAAPSAAAAASAPAAHAHAHHRKGHRSSRAHSGSTSSPHAAATGLHQRVVLARAHEQQRWIAGELRHGVIDADKARSLRDAVRQVGDEQRALNGQRETVDQALAVSHEQDLLDWAIRTAHVGFEPAQVKAG